MGIEHFSAVKKKINNFNGNSILIHFHFSGNLHFVIKIPNVPRVFLKLVDKIENT